MSFCSICKNSCKIANSELSYICSTFDPVPLTGRGLQGVEYLAVFTRGHLHNINSLSVEDDRIALLPNRKARKLRIPNDDRPIYFRLGEDEIPMAFMYDRDEYKLLTKGT